nr:retrotransposon protein, putative, Ty1-copia subclass [Tanacetum cinerariifolium]
MREFHSRKQEEGKSVSSYVLKMKSYIDNLECFGHPVTLGLRHCHLRHISKKCIEKLQHDGLLNSTDLRAFEKYVPCISGKVARKPYTHQVEMAKDLLVLIHIDHKHEVFETFKVFQKEVENQLDETIKSLRSDNEGEYMSQEFLDHLKDHRIMAHRTLPYTSQHNGPQGQDPDFMCLYIDAEEHELGDLGEPVNYKAVLLDHESDKWLNVEMQSIKNKVWDLVDLPPNGKTIGSKCLFKKKTDMDGAVHTYKACLVAKGYTQTLRIDYKETCSHVVHIKAIRILIAIAALYGYEIWQMDVKTTFLNGYLFEEVYMGQPEGFVNPKYLNRTRYVFVLNGGVVDWKRAKQSIFATSSTKVEYIVVFDAFKEDVCVRKFISGLDVVPTIEEPISMYYDNTRAITIANESGIIKGVRNFHAKVKNL